MGADKDFKPHFNSTAFNENDGVQRPATWQETPLTHQERRHLYQMLLYIKDLIESHDSTYREEKNVLDSSTAYRNGIRNQYIQFFYTVRNPNKEMLRGHYTDDLIMVRDFYSRLKDMYSLKDTILNERLKNLDNTKKYPENVFFLESSISEAEDLKASIFQEKSLHIKAMTQCTADIATIDRIIHPPSHCAKIIPFPVSENNL